ncbi:hypothetical protein HG530_002603 [Fusarium avenaceum]|nr:hypothetical protein HG530_002603 [Fusarium avenaceum]
MFLDHQLPVELFQNPVDIWPSKRWVSSANEPVHVGTTRNDKFQQPSSVLSLFFGFSALVLGDVGIAIILFFVVILFFGCVVPVSEYVGIDIILVFVVILFFAVKYAIDDAQPSTMQLLRISSGISATFKKRNGMFELVFSDHHGQSSPVA